MQINTTQHSQHADKLYLRNPWLEDKQVFIIDFLYKWQANYEAKPVCINRGSFSPDSIATANEQRGRNSPHHITTNSENYSPSTISNYSLKYGGVMTWNYRKKRKKKTGFGRKKLSANTRVNELSGTRVWLDLWLLILVGSATGHPDTYERWIR